MHLTSLLGLLVLAYACQAEPEIYFSEKFEDGESYSDRWVESTFKGAEQGQFKLSHGKFYGDAEADMGIQTSTDARFYGISSKIEPAFTNEGKSLVLQFTVKHEQKIDCGGGYAKLYPKDLDQKNLHGDSKYLIMFGPDICGYSTKKVHVIFHYNGKNLLIKKEIKCKDDELTHLYTLVLNPDNTYVVKIDNEKVESGKLEEDWDFLLPKTIPDPNESKPADWVDEEKINDPEAVKPEDWEQPEFIADPDATKPEDWDDEMDGEWSPAKINNPDFKGEWKAKQIDNPAYKGPWVHPVIANPDYTEDDALYKFTDIGAIGFDLWQVKAGTIFDNILLTADETYAAEFGAETWGKTKEPETKMQEEQAAVERAAEEEKRKAEEANKEAAPESNEEDDEPEPEASDDRDEL